ncbi:MAG: phage virion morphogenesis protein [Methylobacter tundripaludum]|nr:phage virion morphogenesis protein [Methylobacter tundripaludum]
MAEVKWDDANVVRALQRLQHAVGDISPALKEIGEDLVESTKQRFSSGVGPDGEKWKDNSQVTIDRKGRNKPLVDRGHLLDSINDALIDTDTLEVNANKDYAAMQQFGGSKDEFPFLWGDIPARPFLGVSDEDEDKILRTVEEYLTSSI